MDGMDFHSSKMWQSGLWSELITNLWKNRYTGETFSLHGQWPNPPCLDVSAFRWIEGTTGKSDWSR